MSKIQKLIEKFQARPTPSNFPWEDLVKILKHLGFEQLSSGKTGGSRRKFRHNNIIISIHEPHPRNELKKYQIEQLLETLKKEKFL